MSRSTDRAFTRISAFIVAVWAFGLLLSCTVVGVLIWAVIKLVNHYT